MLSSADAAASFVFTAWNTWAAQTEELAVGEGAGLGPTAAIMGLAPAKNGEAG
jgi:hypothetical protein